MSGPNYTMPKMPTPQKQANKSTAQAPKGLSTGKMGQSSGHQADVARLSGKIPVR
jgi:hypothetical protein